MPAILSINVMKENAWLLDVPEDDRELAANAAMYFGNVILKQSQQSFTPTMSIDQKEAFSRMEQLLRMAVPTMINQQCNSSTKGKKAEGSCDDLLAQHFGGRVSIHDCSHLAHAGDRMLGSDILLEYKDYARTVPTSEIEKFLRDMSETSAQIGVLCSFNSKFAKYPDGRPTFLKNADKVIILLPSCGYDGEKLVVIVEWALWYVSQLGVRRKQDIHETILKLSKDVVGEVDALSRELSQCSDHMKREIQRLDNARNQSLKALKVRLDVLSDMSEIRR